MTTTYTHDSQPTGTALSDIVYNRAHLNHVTNFKGSTLSSEVANATAMQTTIDPGESGTEVTTASVLEDLRQLAFIIKEMRQTAQWYSGTTTLSKELLLFVHPFGSPSADGPWLWESTTQYSVVSPFLVPSDYVSGDFTVTYSTLGWTSGNLRLTFIVRKAVDGAVVSDEVTTTQTITFGNPVTFTFSADVLAITGTQPILILRRDSQNAADTSTDHIYVQDVSVSYTGYPGGREVY